MSEVASLIPEDHPLGELQVRSADDLIFLGTAAICHLITSWRAKGLQVHDPIIATLDILYTFSDRKPQLSMLRTFEDFSWRGMELAVHHNNQWHAGVLARPAKATKKAIMVATSTATQAAPQLLSKAITNPGVMAVDDAYYLHQNLDFAERWVQGIAPRYIESGYDPGRLLVALQTLPEKL